MSQVMWGTALRRAVSLMCGIVGGALAGLVAAEECAPSRWGADDEVGNANLITQQSVLAAASLTHRRVKTLLASCNGQRGL